MDACGGNRGTFIRFLKIPMDVPMAEGTLFLGRSLRQPEKSFHSEL